MPSLLAWIREPRRATFLMLGLIILIGAWLRLDDFATLLRFNADQVRDIGIVQAIGGDHAWPLLGPKAGGTTFQLGPAFYYLEYLSGLLFGMTPVGTTLLIPLLSLATIGLFFVLFRSVFSFPIALSLTALSGSSFYLAKYARFGWNPNLLPFFLLLFGIALLRIIDPDERRLWRWYALAGLAMGIGMQLHTLTLLLMPVLFGLAHGYRAWEKRRFHLPQCALTLGLVILIFAPVLASEYATGGANTRAFFDGIFLKTAPKTDDLNPILVTADFFLQGQAAVLTGYEPRGQWINPDAWEEAFTPGNTILFIFSLSITLIGGSVVVQKLRSAATPKRERRILAGLAVFSVLAMGLFLLIGNELNIRFFILLAPIPFCLLGLTLQWLMEHPWVRAHLRRFGKPLTVCLLIILGASNLTAYQTTYDFDHPRSLTKAYGGISLSETQGLATRIATEVNQKKRSANIATFDFEDSVQYFLKSDGIKLKTIKETSANPAGRFLILARDAKPEALSDYAARFQTEPLATIGRFQLYWLEPRQ